jgi:hypothetical protein
MTSQRILRDSTNPLVIQKLLIEATSKIYEILEPQRRPRKKQKVYDIDRTTEICSSLDASIALQKFLEEKGFYLTEFTVYKSKYPINDIGGVPVKITSIVNTDGIPIKYVARVSGESWTETEHKIGILSKHFRMIDPMVHLETKLKIRSDICRKKVSS